MIPTTIKTDQISPQLQAKTVTPVKPITPVAPVTIVADPSDNSQQFVQGQKYQALVEGQLPNGRFRVLISDKLFQMHLPAATQPGDKMELQFLSGEPRLKFALLNETQNNTAKNAASISPTGRFLDVLSKNTGQTTASNTPINSFPLLNGTPLNRQELPLLLQKAIHQSGLFYESHLAKWINGKNTLERLQHEPQGKLTINTHASSSPTAVIPVNTQILPLVQQQLMTLETGHILWHGEIWNGQQMEWDIYEESANKQTTREETAPQWKTKLTLTLPELGRITAHIALNIQGVQIKLDAVADETRQLLEMNQSPLKTNMQTAGLTVQLLDIRQDD